VIKLYNYELSGNCYKLRLMMHMLGVKHECIPVNFHPAREHKSEGFLAINPMGQLPALDDGDVRLRDAQAILVYLASRYDNAQTWFPHDPQSRAHVVLWLSIAEDITRTASAARLHDAFGYPFDIEQCRRAAHQIFTAMEEHLADGEMSGRQWLAAATPTIADIACFPYVALAPEGGISLDDYPALRRWVQRVKALPRFIGMPGIFGLGLEPAPPPSNDTRTERTQ